MTELVEPAPPPLLLDVETGEMLPATIEHVPAVLAAARRMKTRMDDLIALATEVVVEESKLRGTKTLTIDGEDIVLSGGPGTEYDPAALAEALRAADCPEERIDAVVKAEITYKVDRGVLRQLTSANEDYRAAAELAARETVKPWRAAPKPPRPR